MSTADLLLLALAGVAGGLANALAGGGTLITFPAFLAAGVPPVVANASNALAIWPAHAMAAWAERATLATLLPAWRGRMALLALGGAAGAALLLASGDRAFLALVPPLLGLATLVFALRRRLAALAGPWLGSPFSSLVLAIYGGYFGAGLGVMLLAWLGLVLPPGTPPAAANALKNLLASLVTAAGILLLVLAGAIDWPAALACLLGAMAGGWLGGLLAGRLPARAVEVVVILAGTGLTLFYAWRLYR
jgi:uncharacterized membrane protein YfcA